MHIILFLILSFLFLDTASAQPTDSVPPVLTVLKAKYVYGEPIELTITNVGKETLSVCSFSLLRIPDSYSQEDSDVQETVIPDLLNTSCSYEWQKVVTPCNNIPPGDSQTLIWQPLASNDNWACKFLLDRISDGRYTISFTWSYYRLSPKKNGRTKEWLTGKGGECRTNTFSIQRENTIDSTSIQLAGLRQSYSYAEPIEFQIQSKEHYSFIVYGFWLERYDDSNKLWLRVAYKPSTSITVLSYLAYKEFIEKPEKIIPWASAKTMRLDIGNKNSSYDGSAISSGMYRLACDWIYKRRMIMASFKPYWKYSEVFRFTSQPFRITH